MEEITNKKKFKFSPRGFSINTFCLCQECDSYLVKEDDKSSKLTKSTWPSFILSTLINKDVISSYGVKAWQLIPYTWRYWWVDTLQYISPDYVSISIESPEPIIVDRSFELDEWKTKLESQKLPDIAQACNKYMIPNVLCPWGCNEFIFRSGFLSIDIVYQRFLRNVSLNMMNDVDTMKYVAYCRDDYIRFNNDYKCLLLNKSWKVMPIVTCKDHYSGCKN